MIAFGKLYSLERVKDSCPPLYCTPFSHLVLLFLLIVATLHFLTIIFLHFCSLLGEVLIGFGYMYLHILNIIVIADVLRVLQSFELDDVGVELPQSLVFAKI